MGFDWDRYQGDYIKFENIGDSVQGEIVDISETRDFNGNPCPGITLDTDAGERRWSVGQAYAKRRLAELKPEVGWEIKVTYESDTPGRPGMNPSKKIEVEVISKGGDGPQSADDL